MVKEPGNGRTLDSALDPPCNRLETVVGREQHRRHEQSSSFSFSFSFSPPFLSLFFFLLENYSVLKNKMLRLKNSLKPPAAPAYISI